MAEAKGQNKRIEELKHGVLYMAQQLGTEQKLREVFDLFEKSIVNAWSLPENQIRAYLFKMAVNKQFVDEYQQALGYFDKLPKGRPGEQETREGIFTNAVKMGVPKHDVIALFDKYDELLKRATTEEQRQQISYMGAAEIHRLLGIKGPLVMDGKLIVPPAPDYVPEEDVNSKFRPVD